jgi:hypothetical protein
MVGISLLESVCGTLVADNAVGAQTERPGAAKAGECCAWRRELTGHLFSDCYGCGAASAFYRCGAGDILIKAVLLSPLGAKIMALTIEAVYESWVGPWPASLRNCKNIRPKSRSCRVSARPSTKYLASGLKSYPSSATSFRLLRPSLSCMAC